MAGFHSEYSGMKFGMFFVGEYLGITLISVMIATLFFGGWLGPVLPPPVWLAHKDFRLYQLLHPVARELCRGLRYDQLMSFGWKVMLAAGAAEPCS